MESRHCSFLLLDIFGYTESGRAIWNTSIVCKHFERINKCLHQLRLLIKHRIRSESGQSYVELYLINLCRIWAECTEPDYYSMRIVQFTIQSNKIMLVDRSGLLMCDHKKTQTKHDENCMRECLLLCYQFSIFRRANNSNIRGKHVNLCIFCVKYSIASRCQSLCSFLSIVRSKRACASDSVYVCVYEEAEYFVSVFL